MYIYIYVHKYKQCIKICDQLASSKKRLVLRSCGDPVKIIYLNDPPTVYTCIDGGLRILSITCEIYTKVGNLKIKPK